MKSINLVISEEVYKDIKKRKGFIPSHFLEEKYRDEFFTRHQIEKLSKKLNELHKKLAGVKETSPVKVGDDPRRCNLCSAFFNPKISFRVREEYKGKGFCKGCMINRKEEVEAVCQKK